MAVRIGFVGCGQMTELHAANLSRMKNVRLVGFTDPATERAQKAAGQYGGEVYPTAEAMLDSADLDAAFICTPPRTRGPAEIAAAKRGIHLFVEKPIALDLKTARSVRAAIEESQIISCVGYHWRYLDTVRRAAKLLAGHKPGMVLAVWLGSLPPPDTWWCLMRESGGQIVEQTTHIIDLARLFGGEVRRVYAALATRRERRLPRTDVPDVGSLTLEFANGAIGQISNTYLGPKRPDNPWSRIGIMFISDEFILDLDWHRLRVDDRKGTREFEKQVNPWEEASRAFVQAVVRKDPSRVLTPFGDAVRSLAISLAALESARTHEPVRPRY